MKNWESVIQAERHHQLKQIQAQLIESQVVPDWMLNKITNFCIRYGLEQADQDLIISRLKSGDLVTISQFMKDPIKQNLSESYLFNQLKQTFSIQKLPSHGKKAYYLSNSTIVTNLKNKPLGLKSLDFKINCNNQSFFIVHKVINERGGGQDHQFNEVVNLIKNLDNHSASQIIFVCDGAYFNQNRLAQLQQLQPFLVQIYNSQNLQNALNNLAN